MYRRPLLDALADHLHQVLLEVWPELVGDQLQRDVQLLHDDAVALEVVVGVDELLAVRVDPTDQHAKREDVSRGGDELVVGRQVLGCEEVEVRLKARR